MFCYNCGKEIPENTLYCPFCGTQVNVAVSGEIEKTAESSKEPDVKPLEEPVHEPEPEVNTGSGGTQEREIAPNAIGSFVWSLVANDLCIIPVLGLIFSIIALTKSIKGRNVVSQNPERYKLKGFLTAAFIISIIDLIGSIVGPILLFSYFSLIGDLFDMSEMSDMFASLARM